MVVLGLMIASTSLQTTFGKNKKEKVDLKIAVSKWQFNAYKEDWKKSWQASPTFFCFDIFKNKVMKHPNCELPKKKKIICGLQNEHKGKWEKTFFKENKKESYLRILEIMSEHNCEEIVFDLEDITPSDSKQYWKWLEFVATNLKQTFKVSFAAYAKDASKVSNPPANLQNYKKICTLFDEIWIMAYDFHIPPYTGPGEVAPIEWVSKVVKYAQENCSSSKIRLGLSAYGYNWTDGKLISEKNLTMLKKSTETLDKRRKKVRKFSGLGIKKYFIWALGMFDRPL